jgi:hypothetical protein
MSQIRCHFAASYAGGAEFANPVARVILLNGTSARRGSIRS